MMEKFEKYMRTNVAEMRPVTEKDIKLFKTVTTVQTSSQPKISISEPDKKNGSPKIGDMIARNPKDHTDQWLVAEKYFKENFTKAIN